MRLGIHARGAALFTLALVGTIGTGAFAQLPPPVAPSAAPTRDAIPTLPPIAPAAGESATPAPPATPVPGPASTYEALLARRIGDEGDGVGMIVSKVDANGTAFAQAGSLLGAQLGPDTLFEIGSVTKLFTATLLALMSDDGEVQLADPVQMYLPGSVHVPTFNGKAMTLLQLATQRSGLPRVPDDIDLDSADPYAGYSVQKLYGYLNRTKLTRAPGDQFEYSNLGVALLGVALANRAHLSYEDLLQKRLLQPLGMTSTTTLRAAGAVAKLAVGHNADGRTAQFWNFDAFAPAGAAISSANDMTKFLQCNLGKGPLARACLLAQQPRDTFPGHKIGLVWWIDDATGIVEHGGDTNGFHAGIAIARDRSAGAVALTNGGMGAIDVALNAVDATQALAIPKHYAVLDLTALSAFTGTYVGVGPLEGVPYTVAIANGMLLGTLGGQAPLGLYATGRDAFEYKAVVASVQFVRAPDGTVAGLHLAQDNRLATFVRKGADASLVPTPAPPGPVPAATIATLPAITATPLSAPVATPAPAPAATLPVAASDFSAYVGTYHTAYGVDFTVTVDKASLFVQLTGQPAVEVYQSSKDHFYYQLIDAKLDFARDATGRVTSLTYHQNGRDVPAPRIK